VRLPGGEAVTALTYVVDRKHDQCASGLDDTAIAALVRQGEGIAGRNIDYVRNTHGHLRSLGLSDPVLDRIVALLAD
jgi:cation transport protein ChaC